MKMKQAQNLQLTHSIRTEVTHDQLHMVCAFGNLAALMFVVCPGERCTSIYRGHGDMSSSHASNQSVLLESFSKQGVYFGLCFEFSSKQDVYFETFPQETFVFYMLLSENNKIL